MCKVRDAELHTWRHLNFFENEARLDRQLGRKPRPYVWTKPAEQILESISRYCQRVNHSGH
jgi:hypothetical protein